MEFILSAIKWVADMLMMAILLGGMFGLWSIHRFQGELPTDASDITWIPITVESIRVSPTGIALTSREYPAMFVAQVTASTATNLSSLIHLGDKVMVRVTKKRATQGVQQMVVLVYGIGLANGTSVFDDSQRIPSLALSHRLVANAAWVWYAVLAVPATYFLVRIFYVLIRPRRAKNAV